GTFICHKIVDIIKIICFIQGEIISIFVGQCGVQIANACWELFCVEHGIGPDGQKIVLPDSPETSDEKELFDCNTFFHENAKGQCTPRTVLLDSEPTVLDEVRAGVYQNLFNAKSLVNGKEDGASNYARGFYQLGQSYKEPFVESLRKIAEACDLLNGLCFFHSYGGGTGSGLLMGKWVKFR
ncbi:unnamed protein product, partial [Schistocephalus solidus]|uniref:Tubulin alpha chain n=1 Tax=Schistocephalus solidus TaxID=70667 RepID=A0A183TDX4_SCHSO